MKKKLTILIITVMAMFSLPVDAFAGDGIMGLVSYTAIITAEGNGSVYYDRGQPGTFFMDNGTVGSYNSSCLASTGLATTWSKLITRSLIAVPSEGCTLDGFYSPEGTRYSFDEKKVDVIRLISKGIYYYDCIPSIDNPEYRNYTKDGYRQLMKSILKNTYGVSRYKVLGSYRSYTLPQKDITVIARFSPLKKQAIECNEKYRKVYGDDDFYIKANASGTGSLTYKSHRPSVLTVDKSTGRAHIKGEGIVKVTINAAADNASLAGEKEITVVIAPPACRLSSTTSKKNGSVCLTWNKDGKCSGHETELCKSSGFKSGVVTGTANGSGTVTKTIKSLAAGTKYYVRVRAYKKSCNEKIYGEWSDVLSVKVK